VVQVIVIAAKIAKKHLLRPRTNYGRKVTISQKLTALFNLNLCGRAVAAFVAPYVTPSNLLRGID
jgi:hypothetical protein